MKQHGNKTIIDTDGEEICACGCKIRIDREGFIDEG
jgi:hypothetical protein